MQANNVEGDAVEEQTDEKSHATYPSLDIQVGSVLFGGGG